MRDRFRTFDSKISFFAFADIITAVSGMLIFITLLLATDLGRPTDSSQSAVSEVEQRIRETLSEQVEMDAQNQRLQELFAIADTAPDSDKLQADIAKLRSQLSVEKTKQTALTDQMAASAADIASRDKILGLTDLKATIQRIIQESEVIVRQETNARTEMAGLDSKVSELQIRLLKLRQRDGQLWLIPDKSTTTKEPILVTVGGNGIAIERFDHPEQRKQWDENGAASGIRSYLRTANPTDQYVVFLVRPSGIGIFQDVSKSARDMGFEIGFDALEEGRQIHFSNPPPIEEPTLPAAASTSPTTKSTAGVTENSSSSSNSVPVATSSEPNKQPPKPAASPPPTKSKNWWEKLLNWLGLK